MRVYVRVRATVVVGNARAHLSFKLLPRRGDAMMARTESPAANAHKRAHAVSMTTELFVEKRSNPVAPTSL